MKRININSIENDFISLSYIPCIINQKSFQDDIIHIHKVFPFGESSNNEYPNLNKILESLNVTENDKEKIYNSFKNNNHAKLELESGFLNITISIFSSSFILFDNDEEMILDDDFYISLDISSSKIDFNQPEIINYIKNQPEYIKTMLVDFKKFAHLLVDDESYYIRLKIAKVNDKELLDKVLLSNINKWINLKKNQKCIVDFEKMIKYSDYPAISYIYIKFFRFGSDIYELFNILYEIYKHNYEEHINILEDNEYFLIFLNGRNQFWNKLYVY